MFGVLSKPGIEVKLTKAGVRILSALDATCREMNMDITVTCGCEDHPPDDAHTLGEAFDIRSHDLKTHAEKLALVRTILRYLQDDMNDLICPTSIGLATLRFYAQLENPGLPTEHIHVQRRKGTVYT